MLEPQSDISARPEIDAKKLLSIDVIAAYLDKQLPDFPRFFKDRHSATHATDSEATISQVLCVFLNTFRRPYEVLLFDFETEWKTSRNAVDFAVIDVKSFKESNERPKPFFAIEAKRLPPPQKDSKGRSREREYVQGGSGGIQRYKKGLHGAGLSQSAIIGYIQKNDCSYWHAKINGWIGELVLNNTDINIYWDSNDLLKEMNIFGEVRKYNSQNTRVTNSGKDTIELHHYLVELT